MHFFHKKKIQCYLMTRSFENVMYVSICMLRNCLCFYFRLLIYVKIKFLQTNHQDHNPNSNSLDSDQDRDSVGLHLGSNCLQKAIGRRQNYPLACKEL